MSRPDPYSNIVFLAFSLRFRRTKQSVNHFVARFQCKWKQRKRKKAKFPSFMACLISSFSFSMRLCASQTLDKEILPWRSARGRFSRSAASKTAIKLLAPDCSCRGESSVDRSCNHHIMKRYRHFYGSVSLHSNVSFSTQTVISGFWVGPDIEDGWGFVEAFVNQIV